MTGKINDDGEALKRLTELREKVYEVRMAVREANPQAATDLARIAWEIEHLISYVLESNGYPPKIEYGRN